MLFARNDAFVKQKRNLNHFKCSINLCKKCMKNKDRKEIFHNMNIGCYACGTMTISFFFSSTHPQTFSSSSLF